MGVSARAISVSKAVRSVQRVGLAVTGVEIMPDGTVRILTSPPAVTVDDELERARERRRARKIDRAA